MLTEGRLVDLAWDFLNSYRDQQGRPKYREEASRTIAQGRTSLAIDFVDLLTHDKELASELLFEPDTVLGAFDKAVYQLFTTLNPALNSQNSLLFRARVKGLTEKVPLRDISSAHIDRLIAVGGLVVRASEVRPYLLQGIWRCNSGHLTKGDFIGQHIKRPPRCAECGSTELSLDKRQSVFSNYQLIRVQELPEELPPGQLPQYIDVQLFGDLANSARPGDRVIITGIVRSEPEGFGTRQQRIFTSRLEGNYVEALGREIERLDITPEDEERIRAFSQQSDVFAKLVESIAPAIKGHMDIKEAILLALVGAPQVTLPDGTTLRGYINVLLVGDPGTAKTELLKYAARLAPRGLYTTGRGSTAAGLTAAVVKERGGMLMLEAGAVVLADQGVACIDEFEKMRAEDRQVLHEVMEQNTVSVAKGGIVATLNARTSILAAANPVLGKYDPMSNIYDNLNLPIPLLTRFDLIFVIMDVPQRDRDEAVARHILQIYRDFSYPTPPPVDFEFLRKYIIYAKRIRPILTKEAEEKILSFYLNIRSTAPEGMITITHRQLETLVRLAMARARLLLRDRVLGEDADHAIRLFVSMLESVAKDVRTGRVDVGVLYGKPYSFRTLFQRAQQLFKDMEQGGKVAVDIEDFKRRFIQETGASEEEADKIITQLRQSGMIYEVSKGKFKYAAGV